MSLGIFVTGYFWSDFRASLNIVHSIDNVPVSVDEPRTVEDSNFGGFARYGDKIFASNGVSDSKFCHMGAQNVLTARK